MKLTENGIGKEEFWRGVGIRLPGFSRKEVCKRTHDAPFWLHFGAGNIFRAYQAKAVQTLLETGVLDRGILVAEGYDREILTKAYRPFDCLSLLVTLKANGTVEKQVIGSVTEALDATDAASDDFPRLREIFSNPSLQMVSFTITEKGYALKDGEGNWLPEIAEDRKAGPKAPKSYLGRLAALLYERYRHGRLPLAMVSMDNCSHNGEKLFQAMRAFGEAWQELGEEEKGFLAYLSDPKRVSFPWTMIDKITPRPDASVLELLQEDGLEGMEPVVTEKHSYVAPFVNAEECEYLVVEDAFPNGRPPLEGAGLLFASRETVNACERMKVCTCLNPLHTGLAVFGCLLGCDSISQEMKDTLLEKLARQIGEKEGLPAVTDPGILSPQKFLNEVLTVRLPNPFLPDTPQRIATDTSQKLSVRYGETIKTYCEDSSLQPGSLVAIPLVFAGWLRYLTGIDDQGSPFSLSPDPLLPLLKEKLAGLTMGISKDRLCEIVTPLLSDSVIFGVDLFQVGLAEKVQSYLWEMLREPGAVRKTLETHLR